VEARLCLKAQSGKMASENLVSKPWLPDFSIHNIPKQEKCTKLPQHYLIAIKCNKWL
jgi:hypothetical protein